MKKIILNSARIVLIASVLSLGVGVVFAATTWTPAPPNPPQTNVDAPINVGYSAQSKKGMLDIIGLQSATVPYANGLIVENGNVGIGTTNPGSYKLNVNGDIFGNSLDVSRLGTSDLTADNQIFINGGLLTLRPGTIGTSQGKKPGASTWNSWSDFNNWDFNSTQNDTCPSNGNNPANDNTDDFSCTGLNSVSDCYDRAQVIIGSTNYGSATRELKCFAESGSYTIKNSANSLALVNGTNQTTFSLDQSGNVVAAGSLSAQSFLYSSDINLKKNILPLTDQLNKILQLQGVSFNWKSNDRKDVGLIAQDVEKVYPELVSTNKETGLKSVEYGNLVAPVIESIKEQQAEINKLESLVSDQQKEIDLLKSAK